MADHHLPRPLQVVILAISTSTETSGHPLAQFFTLFLPVLIVFAANVVKGIAGARNVAGMRLWLSGSGARGAFRGRFSCRTVWFSHVHHYLMVCITYLML